MLLPPCGRPHALRAHKGAAEPEQVAETALDGNGAGRGIRGFKQADCLLDPKACNVARNRCLEVVAEPSAQGAGGQARHEAYLFDTQGMGVV